MKEQKLENASKKNAIEIKNSDIKKSNISNVLIEREEKKKNTWKLVVEILAVLAAIASITGTILVLL